VNIRRVLVANRGEIAIRVLRGLRELGIVGVAVHTDVDRGALHVEHAAEAVAIGEPLAYLDIPRIVQAARDAKCDAVHPGYGFLSENAAFAEAVQKAGLIFIGPDPATISSMGDKVRARELAAKADVPLVPGTGKGLADDVLAREADRLGYPVLVKAAAGGGGKGMRVVRAPADLENALSGARHEAQKAFGDASVFLEKYIENPRHVEIQILADHHGHVIHCLERECSIQRRHQKVVEECPSPVLTPELRERMGSSAVALAKATGYKNAGTVEFILAPDGRYYFLEGNTRLQVEHPVTELVTGLDLVAWQVKIAAGERLTVRQEDVVARGHAIEVRLCAEDPAQNYMPQSGRILAYAEPEGPGIRIDSGVTQGSEITPNYDPMIAKLIVHAPDRESARRRLRRALEDLRILGVRTNQSLLAWIAAHPEFAEGKTDTAFLVRNPPPAEHADAEALARVAAIAAALVASAPASTGGGPATGPAVASGPFSRLGGVWLG
jgi:acetyl-CoA carboxylase biotin carboxylase subunit